MQKRRMGRESPWKAQTMGRGQILPLLWTNTMSDREEIRTAARAQLSNSNLVLPSSGARPPLLGNSNLEWPSSVRLLVNYGSVFITFSTIIIRYKVLHL